MRRRVGIVAGDGFEDREDVRAAALAGAPSESLARRQKRQTAVERHQLALVGVAEGFLQSPFERRLVEISPRQQQGHAQRFEQRPTLRIPALQGTPGLATLFVTRIQGAPRSMPAGQAEQSGEFIVTDSQRHATPGLRPPSFGPGAQTIVEQPEQDALDPAAEGPGVDAVGSGSGRFGSLSVDFIGFLTELGLAWTIHELHPRSAQVRSGRTFVPMLSSTGRRGPDSGRIDTKARPERTWTNLG